MIYDMHDINRTADFWIPVESAADASNLAGLNLRPKPAQPQANDEIFKSRWRWHPAAKKPSLSQQFQTFSQTMRRRSHPFAEGLERPTPAQTVINFHDYGKKLFAAIFLQILI